MRIVAWLLMLPMVLAGTVGLPDDPYVIDLHLFSRFDRDQNKGTLEIRAHDIGKSPYPESAVWTLSMRPVEFVVDWKTPSLIMVEKKDGAVRENVGLKKREFRTSKAGLAGGLYIVELSFDPAQQTDAVVHKQMGAAFTTYTFPRTWFVGDIKGIIDERELLLAEWEKFSALLEKVEKAAMSSKDWKSQRPEFAREVERFLHELVMIKKLSWFTGTAAILTNSTHDLLNYTTNLDHRDLADERRGEAPPEKDLKDSGKKQAGPPAVEGGMKTSYGERLSFRNLKAGVRKGMSLLAREQWLYHLYDADNALGAIGCEDRYRKEELAEYVQDTEGWLAGFREDVSKTKLAKVYQEMFDRDKLGEEWDQYVKGFQKVMGQYEKGVARSALQKEILLLQEPFHALQEKIIGSQP